MSKHRGDGPGARRMGELCAALVAMATAILAALPADAAGWEVLGRWGLDEGAGQHTADVSGHGHGGRLGGSGGPDSHDPAWVPGRFGNGLRFLGGDNQFVSISEPGTLAPARITVEAWVRRLGTPGRWRYVVARGSHECAFSSFGLYTGVGDGIAFYVSDGANYVRSPAVGPAAAWDGAWHHAAGTYDGGNVRLYFDGVEVGGGTPAQIAISYGLTMGDVYLGTYRGSCERPFTGDVDEVLIHDEALSATEVATAFALAERRPEPPQQAPVAGPPAGPPAPRSCVTVRAMPRRLTVHRRTRVRVVVRHLGRAAPGRRVILRGLGLRRSARTGRRGRAKLVVRPRRRGVLKVLAAGQPRGCDAVRLKVRRPRR
jgi:hypothetical protein